MSVPDVKTQLLAVIADGVRTLIWQNTEDGHKGRNKPESVLQKLIDGKKENETMSFATAEEFEAERNRIVNSGR